MKQLIGSDIGEYTFSPSAKTVTFFGVVIPALENILLISNVTYGIVIYSFADPDFGVTFVNNVLTLEYDTTAMLASDALQIWVDLPNDIAVMPNVAPAGIDVPGQRPAAISFPVVLPPEQVLDLNTTAGFGVGSAGNNALLQSGAWIDASQFRSVAFSVTAPTGVTVTLSFEGNMDGSNTAVAIPLYDSAAPTTAPVTSVAVTAATTRFFEGPLKYRFFRARISTAVAGGPINTATRLSMAPWSGAYAQVANSAGNWSSNIAQYGGSNIVNAGLAGVPSVGGNTAAGVTPTVNPVQIGGVDTGGLGRRLLTDISGQLVAVGPDLSRAASTNPLRVQQLPSSLSDRSIQEILEDLCLNIKYLNSMIKDLPAVLNTPGGVYSDDFESFKNNFIG